MQYNNCGDELKSKTVQVTSLYGNRAFNFLSILALVLILFGDMQYFCIRTTIFSTRFYRFYFPDISTFIKILTNLLPYLFTVMYSASLHKHIKKNSSLTIVFILLIIDTVVAMATLYSYTPVSVVPRMVCLISLILSCISSSTGFATKIFVFITSVTVFCIEIFWLTYDWQEMVEDFLIHDGNYLLFSQYLARIIAAIILPIALFILTICPGRTQINRYPEN